MQWPNVSIGVCVNYGFLKFTDTIFGPPPNFYTSQQPRQSTRTRNFLRVESLSFAAPLTEYDGVGKTKGKRGGST